MASDKLTIAIDFDDTFTADPELWSHVIAEMQRRGHRVICVSGCRNTLANRTLRKSALPSGVDLFVSYDCPKRWFMKQHRIDVDIWIDDRPESIPGEG